MTAYVVDVPPSYNFEFNGVDIELMPTGDVTLEMDAGNTVLFTLADNIESALVFEDSAQPLFSVHTTAVDRRIAIRDALQIGLDPGSGAGSAAASGGLRMQGNGAVLGQVVFRDATDAGDLGGISAVAGNSVIVGGPYPVRPASVNVDATNVRMSIAGAWRLDVTNLYIRLAVPDFYFQSVMVAPSIYQETDATAGVVGDDFEVHAQDVSSAAVAPAGGGIIVRSGGDAGGALNPSSGDVEVYCGAFGGTGTRGTMYIGRDAADTAANRALVTNIGGANAVYLQVGGTTRLTAGGAFVDLNVPDLRFVYFIANPTISQTVDATAGVTGDDLTVAAQSVSDPAGGATAGNLGLTGGQGTVHANNLDGNVWFHVAAANYQAMEKGIFVADVVTAPTGNPANGGFLYANAGTGTWRGSGGTITAFGPADHHCEKCGYDFWTNHFENPAWGAYLKECGMCGEIYKRGPASVLGKLTGRQKTMLVRHGAGEWN